MAATVNQLIAAAEKTAAIANGIERQRRALAPYDVDRLAEGIAALNVAKIGGAVVIDPRAEVRKAVYASGMGQIARVGEQSRQMIASVAKRPVFYDLGAAVQAVITPIVLDVMEAGRQAAGRGLQAKIPLAVQMLADSATLQIKGFLDMRLALAPDWAGLLDFVGKTITIIAERWKEGTFTGDVMRVAYEGEYYTQEEAEAALDRLVAITFTERSVFGEDVDPDLWPLLAPSLLRQAIREIPDGVSDAKLKRWLRARMAQLAGARYMRQCRVMREALIPQSGQVLTLASAPALESGAGPAPSDGQRIAPDGPKVPSRPADYMRWSRIWLYVRSRIGKDGNEEICDWLGKVHKEKCSEDTLSKIIKAGLAGLLDNPKLG